MFGMVIGGEAEPLRQETCEEQFGSRETSADDTDHDFHDGPDGGAQVVPGGISCGREKDEGV